MKKRYSLLFFFLLFLPSAYTQLYVAAPSGLSLREAPNKESKKLDLLPFGTMVTANYESIWSEEIDGYHGHWFEVKYNGKQGYIFDGYTLPLSVPIKDYNDPFTYLNDILGAPVLFDSVAPQNVDGSFSYYLYTAYYKNGIIFSYAPGYEQHEYSLINLDMSLQQAYLLACLLDRAFDCVYKNMASESEFNTSYPLKTTKYTDYSVSVDPDTSIKITTEHYFMKIFYLNGRAGISWGGGV